MTRDELQKFSAGFFGQCLEMMAKKNADYSGSTDDALGNFKVVEQLGIKTEQGFLTRMMDKMKRIATFVRKDKLAVSENVSDTLLDLANYTCLLAAYIHEKNINPTDPDSPDRHC